MANQISLQNEIFLEFTGEVMLDLNLNLCIDSTNISWVSNNVPGTELGHRDIEMIKAWCPGRTSDVRGG